MRFGLITSTRLAFIVPGYGMSAWAPLIPYVQKQIGLGTGQLGMTLLSFGAGAMATMPVGGGLVGKIGCRRLFAVSGCILAFTFPLLAIASSAWELSILLFGLGVAMGFVGCARNLHGIYTERALNRRLMSGFLGFYSIGCILGAGTMSMLLGAGLTPFFSLLAVAIVMTAAVVISTPQITDERSAPGTAVYVRPYGVVLTISMLCFIVFMAEGSVLDWSAILLSDHFRLDPARAGMGYVAFATAMTVGRLLGDTLVRQLGDQLMLVFGPLLAAFGVVVAVLPIHWMLAVGGFALIGAGLANVTPLLYSALGRQKIMPQNLALTSAGGIGSAGILTGPAAIGFIAQWTNLTTSFAILAVFIAIVAHFAPRTVCHS